MSTTNTPPNLPDPRNGLRAFLVLDGALRLGLWVVALTGALATVSALDGWPKHALFGGGLYESWAWVDKFVWVIFFFNVYYILALVVLRLPIPSPREGTYRIVPGKIPPGELIKAMLIGALTKARYEVPFPGFLVHHVANLPVLSFLMSRIFGPRTRSTNVTDPLYLDPYGIEVGKNVVVGYGAIISAHAQTRDTIEIKKTVIEDNVLIGGNVIIYHGCRIKNGAVLMGGAVLRPGTVVGENEVWGGIPAKLIKTLPPYGVEESGSPADGNDAAAN